MLLLLSRDAFPPVVCSQGGLVGLGDEFFVHGHLHALHVVGVGCDDLPDSLLVEPEAGVYAPQMVSNQLA